MEFPPEFEEDLIAECLAFIHIEDEGGGDEESSINRRRCDEDAVLVNFAEAMDDETFEMWNAVLRPRER